MKTLRLPIARRVRRPGLWLNLCTMLLGLGSALRAAEPPPPPWHYVNRLGLADARHTAPDGSQVSDVVALSAGNYALGSSDLFVGDDDVPAESGRRAQTAWVAGSDGVTHRVGLYDTTHTRDDGRQESYPLTVNDAGVSVGAATRFLGHDFGGYSAWVATRSGASLRVGFYDAAHTASFGGTISAPVALNAADKFIGYSENPETGHRTAWIANAIGQFGAIGLTDGAHTTEDGRHATFPVDLNDAGYVIGNADFYGASVDFPGSTAWVRRPDRVVRVIGFQSGVHEAPNGQHVSRVELLTESGYMAGWSMRYGTGANDGTGQTAWVTHVDGPNRPVGFRDGIHVGANGVMHSQVAALNENGNAIGTSFQYVGADPDEFDVAGSTAWITTPAGATVRVGLYDAEHTANGRQFNEVVALSETGSLSGIAVRYNAAGDYFGSDAFVANAAGQTGRLGLFDAMHTRDDGYHASFAGDLTDGLGYVAGASERYNGGANQVGQTAWIYSRSAHTYVRLELSVRASDGYAESTITKLLDDGSAIGRFRLFSSSGADLGERAFAYVPGRGAFLVEDNLDVNAGQQGWSAFLEATLANENGFITGLGARPNGAGVYLLNEAAASSAGAARLLHIRIQVR